MNKLYFLHIPKTAGSTVVYTIDEQLQNTKLKYYSYGYSLSDLDLKKDIYVAGHFGTYPIENEKFDIACLIREPIERSVSHFNYIYNRSLRFLDEYKKNNSYIDQMKYYLFEDSARLEHNNYQSKFLCNPINPVIFEKDISTSGDLFLDVVYGKKLKDWYIKNDNTSIDYAKKQINSFKIINTVENIDIFMEKIIKWFKDEYKVSLSYNKNLRLKQSMTEYKNVKYTTEELISYLNEDDKKQILNNNYIDYEIYKSVKEKELNEISRN